MTKAEIKGKVNDLINAPSCYAGLKSLAEEWLATEGTPGERAVSERLIAELEADVQPIGEVLAFFESDDGKKAFGAEMAGQIAAHAKEVIAAGGKWCDCLRRRKVHTGQ